MRKGEVMSTHYRLVRKCYKCDEMITPTTAGLYHCNNKDCIIAHFQVDACGNYHSITYCVDVREERA